MYLSSYYKDIVNGYSYYRFTEVYSKIVATLGIDIQVDYGVVEGRYTGPMRDTNWMIYGAFNWVPLLTINH